MPLGIASPNQRSLHSGKGTFSMRHLRSLFALLGLISVTTSVMAQEPVGQPPKDAAGKPSPESYLVGFDTGMKLLQSGFNATDFEMTQFVKGFRDALTNQKPALSEQEIEATAQALDAKLQARANEANRQQAVLGQANLEKSKAFLAENQKKDGVQTLKSGLHTR